MGTSIALRSVVMVSVESLVKCLHEVGVGFFVGVPDSPLKSFCAHVTDNCGENEVVRRIAYTNGV